MIVEPVNPRHIQKRKLVARHGLYKDQSTASHSNCFGKQGYGIYRVVKNRHDQGLIKRFVGYTELVSDHWNKWNIHLSPVHRVGDGNFPTGRVLNHLSKFSAPSTKIENTCMAQVGWLQLISNHHIPHICPSLHEIVKSVVQTKLLEFRSQKLLMPCQWQWSYGQRHCRYRQCLLPRQPKACQYTDGHALNRP